MYNYANNGITISSILDSRSGNKNNEYPIKIRVTYKRKRIYYSTGKKLCLQDWEKLSDTKSLNLIEIRRDIQYAFDKIKENTATIIHTNNMICVDGNEAELTMQKALFSFEPYLLMNRKTRNTVAHISINPSPDDKLDNAVYTPCE